jgi:hypothetical protein
MKLSRIHIVALLAAVVFSSGGCALINRVRAKNALNEGARAYKDGRFKDAEDKFREAYSLDESQKNAPLFIARAVQQQYKPGVQTPENLQMGERAVQAYQEILNRDPANEDAYKAIVFLYGQMKRDDKVNELLQTRAEKGSTPNARAEALVILASKKWQCAYDITERKENQTKEEKDNKIIVHYKKPGDQGEFDKARQCADEGMKLAEQAVSLNAGSASAWSYKANLLREQAKLAEMDGNASDKSDLDKKYDQALTEQKRLTKEEADRKEAEAAKSPAPPAS